jgi:hypothetical protein
MRQDRVGPHLHCSICKALAPKGQTNGTHTAKPICDKEDVTVFWNQGVHTDREVVANRPDIIIKNKKQNACILKRRGNTGGRKCNAKERRDTKIQKSLCTEIKQMWYMKRMIIPVITGANAIVTKGLKKNLEAIQLIHYNRQLDLEHHT